MMFSFQTEFRRIVEEAQDMDMEVFCSLTNSNIKFIGGLRALIEKSLKLNVLSEEEIMMVASANSGHKLQRLNEKFCSNLQHSFQENRRADAHSDESPV